MSSPAEPITLTSSMTSVTGRTRVRIRFSKLGKVRFTSHRDTARIWERALRRVEAPVAYTEGFSPRPRLSFGLARVELRVPVLAGSAVSTSKW